MTASTFDPARKYLVPVARLDLPDEPDVVHLSVYEWLPQFEAWATGIALCGYSTRQGALPADTKVTCGKCLEFKPGYDKVLAEHARAAAERAAHRVRSAANPSDRSFSRLREEAPPADELRDTIAEAMLRAVGEPGEVPTLEEGLVVADLADAVLPAIGQLRAGRATWKAKAEEIERDRDRLDEELARVSALHADTERQLRADLADEVRKREAAEATAETFRHKAVRRGLRLARVTGVLEAVREMAAEEVTARNEWGDGYRDAIRDLNELLDSPEES